MSFRRRVADGDGVLRRMVMTPIGPEEQVDESEVMNVTDKVTGETSRYRRRRRRRVIR